MWCTLLHAGHNSTALCHTHGFANQHYQILKKPNGLLPWIPLRQGLRIDIWSTKAGLNLHIHWIKTGLNFLGNISFPCNRAKRSASKVLGFTVLFPKTSWIIIFIRWKEQSSNEQKTRIVPDWRRMVNGFEDGHVKVVDNSAFDGQQHTCKG